MQTRFFASLAEFAAFLPRAKVAELVADTEGRTAASAFFAHEMHDRIGDRDRLPPPLADSTVMERLEKGYSADEPLLASGVLRDSIGHENVSVRKTVAGSTDPKAVWHEFGPTNGRFPARSFVASTAQEHEEEAFEIYVKTFGGLVPTEVVSDDLCLGRSASRSSRARTSGS